MLDVRAYALGAKPKRGVNDLGRKKHFVTAKAWEEKSGDYVQ